MKFFIKSTIPTKDNPHTERYFIKSSMPEKPTPEGKKLIADISKALGLDTCQKKKHR